ncbi:MAG TPA: ATP-binding protein [Candidatus Wirthbacteria bacterium]|nr:ATP-binding protein [Candidatus Wirthbacteria bacterium]
MKIIERLLTNRMLAELDAGKVIILLGARQVGKTTLIRSVYGGEGTIYLNLDIQIEQARLQAAGDLTPEAAIGYLGGGDTIIIDEAQRLPAVGRIVKGWYDSDLPVKCVLLGSAGLNILDKTAEPLTGRNIKYYLTPLLFEEVLRHQDWFGEGIDLSRFGSQIELLRQQFLVLGGYPEVITNSDPVLVLQTVYQDYLFKDVYGLELVGSRAKLQKLLSLLAYQVGSEFSTHELANQLGISRNTIDRYLEILEDTFVIFRLQAWSRNPRKELSKKSKIYFWDNGIRNAAINNFSPFEQRSDQGALWENFMVSEMIKRDLTLDQRQRFYFWRTYSGSEVDLVIQKDESLRAIEIKSRSTRLSSKIFENSYQTRVELVHPGHYLDYVMG